MTPSFRATVIIPTRERSRTLRHALETCVRQDYADLEILVSDNASQDDTRDVVHSFDDRRIRYINTGRRVDMSANWDFALRHASGDFVCILGDDDGFCPGGVRLAMNLLRESGADCVGWRVAGYGWPESPIEVDASRLSFLARPGADIREAREVWTQFVHQDRPRYNDLFGLYANGFAPMAMINARRERFGGQFIRSPMPDVFSAIVLTRALQRQVYCELPLAIAGASASSNGVSAQVLVAKNEGAAAGEVARFLGEIRETTWNRRITYARSLGLGITDAWLSAEEDPNGYIADDGRAILVRGLAWAAREASELPDNFSEPLWKAIDAVAARAGLDALARDLKRDWPSTYRPPVPPPSSGAKARTGNGIEFAGAQVDLVLDPGRIQNVQDAAALIGAMLAFDNLERIPLRRGGVARRLMQAGRVLHRVLHRAALRR